MAHALIFDSGVGGLSVAAEIAKALPALRRSYAADDAFRPYGDKSEAALRARLPELLATLENMLAPDVIVIACNTASTTALPQIRAAVSVPVVGVVPAIKPAAQITRTGTIAVLGTPGTVRQKYVGGLIKDFAPDKQVILHGSVGLVALAEAKLAGQAVDMQILADEIAPLFSGPSGGEIDAVVLACTHFPLLRDELMTASQSFTQQNINWIDSGEAIARRVKSVLAENTPKVNAPTSHPEEQRDTAFLIGPKTKSDISPSRKSGFARFGFETLVAI
ncbi:MAG: glutamate racemase [Maricaulaceae bacterium]